MKSSISDNEIIRLETLRKYHILDTAPEQAFDDITKIAAFICGTPIALISLVDRERQWFKSRLGLHVDQTPREQAFCAYTILHSGLLEVEDATKDSRFSDNPLVTGDPEIRFYAGSPLQTPDGYALGSICVIDQKPRRLSDEQKSNLAGLARFVMTNLELRRISADMADALARVKILSGLLPICAWCKNIRNDKGYWKQVEDYVQEHTDFTFTHGLCPDCGEKHFPGTLVKKAD